MLLRVNAKSESDEIEIISFILKTEEFLTKTMRIFRYFKSSEIRYIIQNFVKNETEQNLIYILANIGSDENYFFSLDYNDGKITEFNIINEVGLLPSFQKLNTNLLVTIGGVSGNNANVCIFDTYVKKWTFLGTMSSPRTGAYAMLNEVENIVYICGGINNEGDNTFDIECFSLDNLILGQNTTNYSIISTTPGGNLGIAPTPQVNLITPKPTLMATPEMKQIKIKNNFLLRKINPIVVPIFEENTYLIIGGSNLFHETNTCTVFYTDREIILLSNSKLPKPFSTTSQNYFYYKNSIYFFISDNEVIRYSVLDNSYEVIQKDLIEV